MSEALMEKGKGSGQFLEEEVLVLFTSQVQHYVTPKFYTETKPVSGKVVPTWVRLIKTSISKTATKIPT